MEKWKTINGYEDYEVSDLGRVRSVRYDRILKPHILGIGYRGVHLFLNKESKSKYIHKLVADAFLRKNSKRCDINHIDGDKTNNKLSNLERCTRSNNLLHAYRTGLKKPKIGVEHGRRILTEKQVYEIRSKYKSGKYLQKELAEKYKTSNSVVGDITRGETWRHLLGAPKYGSTTRG